MPADQLPDPDYVEADRWLFHHAATTTSLPFEGLILIHRIQRFYVNHRYYAAARRDYKEHEIAK